MDGKSYYGILNEVIMGCRLDEPVEEFIGKIIAIVHRNDDVEEKWVVAPEERS